MPFYQHLCGECGKRDEVLQRVDAEPPECKSCKAKMTKQVSRTSFILKGGGWFKDSYSAPASASSESS